MSERKTIYERLSNDKIKINGNKNPIKVDDFLSYLTIETEISTSHLGSCNGWTRRFNKEYSLIIYGGIVKGVNYLDAIKYGRNLDNPYNNYVNPFYLKDIMTKEGINFFADYYNDEIKELIQKQEKKIARLKRELKEAKSELSKMKSETKQIEL